MVQTGVRQGCLLSPLIFLIVIDSVMRQTTSGTRTGIQWTFAKQLEYLDLADDLCLLSYTQQDMQTKTERLAEVVAKNWSLRKH